MHATLSSWGNDDVPEELEELSMSDDDTPLSKLNESTRIKYSCEELMDLKDAPGSHMKPKVLSEEFFNDDGLWNPHIWHSSHSSGEANYRPSASAASISGRGLLSRRLNNEPKVPLLSPHRQSFGVGCHVSDKSRLSMETNEESAKNAKSCNQKIRERRDRSNSFSKTKISDIPKRSSVRSSTQDRSEVKIERKRFLSCSSQQIADVNNNKFNAERPVVAPVEAKVLEKVPKEPIADQSKLRRDSEDPLYDVVFADSSTAFDGPEPEWMSAADNADMEFDFGNLEDLKKQFNDKIDNRAGFTVREKQEKKFDINDFLNQQPRKQAENENNMKQSRLTQLFAKGPEIVPIKKNPQEVALAKVGNASKGTSGVLDVQDLEGLDNPPPTSSQDLRAFNDLLSKVKPVANQDEPVNLCRIPSPGLELYTRPQPDYVSPTVEQMGAFRPFSPFSNPEGYKASKGVTPFTDANANVVTNVANSDIKQSRFAHLFDRQNHNDRAMGNTALSHFSDAMQQSNELNRGTFQFQQFLPQEDSRQNAASLGNSAYSASMVQRVAEPNEQLTNVKNLASVLAPANNPRGNLPPGIPFDNPALAAAVLLQRQNAAAAAKVLPNSPLGAPGLNTPAQSALTQQIFSAALLRQQQTQKLVNTIANSTGASNVPGFPRGNPISLPPQQQQPVSAPLPVTTRANPLNGLGGNPDFGPINLYNSVSNRNVSLPQNGALPPNLLLRAQAIQAARGRAALLSQRLNPNPVSSLPIPNAAALNMPSANRLPQNLNLPIGGGPGLPNVNPPPMNLNPTQQALLRRNMMAALHQQRLASGILANDS